MKFLIIVLIFVFTFTVLHSDKIPITPQHDDPLKVDLERKSSGTIIDDGYNKHATPYEAKQMVLKAVEYINKHGMEDSSKQFCDREGEFFYLDLYIFVFDMKGNILCHGRDESLIGKNHYYLKDSVGKYFVQDFIELMETKDQGWIEYYWRNYETFDIEEKITFLKKVGEDYFVGCGAYKRKK